MRGRSGAIVDGSPRCLLQKELGAVEFSSLGFVPPNGEGGGAAIFSPLEETSCQGGGASGKVEGPLPPQAPRKKQKKRGEMILMLISIMIKQIM